MLLTQNKWWIHSSIFRQTEWVSEWANSQRHISTSRLYSAIQVGSCWKLCDRRQIKNRHNKLWEMSTQQRRKDFISKPKLTQLLTGTCDRTVACSVSLASSTLLLFTAEPPHARRSFTRPPMYSSAWHTTQLHSTDTQASFLHTIAWIQGSNSFTGKKNPGLFQKIYIYLQYSQCSPLQKIQQEAKCCSVVQINSFTYGFHIFHLNH